MLAETVLLKILDDANAPHYLFKEIMEWACKFYNKKYNFKPSSYNRKNILLKMKKWQGLDKCIPKQIPMQFEEDGLKIELTAFDFQSQLLSLLKDPTLVKNIDLLDVNKNDPFSKYQSPTGRLTCFNSGSWYHNAWIHCIENENDWLCPIIFGCDETLVGSHLGRASCTPLHFTLSIFSEELRSKSTSWRTLGYIYDLSQHGAKGLMDMQHNNNSRKFTRDEKSRRYHKILRAILDSYIQVQQSNGISNIDIRLGNYQKTVNIKVPCAMIIGDMQGGDKHCGSSIGYSAGLSRLCRQCNVQGCQSGDPLVKCKKMSMSTIKGYVQNGDIDKLNKINQYNVNVAWFDVDFGGCDYGIFSAAMPVEALHSLEGGLMEDVLKILFEKDLKPYYQTKLDGLAIKMLQWDKQYYLTAGTNPDMPRTLFKDGICTLTKLSHVVGIVLVVTIMSLTDDGRAMFLEAFQRSGYPNPTK